MKSASALAVAAAVMSAGSDARAEEPTESAPLMELEELRESSLETRRALQTSVLTSGIASIAIGIALTVPDNFDQGLRFAGINTIGFGVINTIVGGVALAGIAEEERWEASNRPRSPEEYGPYSAHAVADESREGWGHGINLGLAGAYAAIGGMAIAVSQVGVEHPNRWLGSGIAIATQAAHLVAVDLIGTVTSRQYEARMQELSPSVGYDPSNENKFVGANFKRRF